MGPVESGRGGDPGARKQPAVASAIGATSRTHAGQPIAERRFTVASGAILAESAAPPHVDDIRLAARYGHLEHGDVVEVPPQEGFVFR
jgi:hypothetical protein